LIATHARLHVKPPLVERATVIELSSLWRQNAICAMYAVPPRSNATAGSPPLGTKPAFPGPVGVDGNGMMPSYQVRPSSEEAANPVNGNPFR
jgi:hypothetical protein